MLWGSVLLAFPTLLVDVYRISTFDKRDERTYYISNDDLRAYRWIKGNLPREAVIQDMPTGISGIVALAERRTALGDWEHAKGYQIGSERVAERHRDIYHALFQGNDVADAIDVLRKYGIQYVYVGHQTNQKVKREAVEKFERFPEYFIKIYSAENVAIYQFEADDFKTISSSSENAKQLL